MASLQWSWAYTQSPTAGSNSGWTPIPSLLSWSGLYRLIGWWSQERQPRWIAWLDSLRPPKPSNEATALRERSASKVFMQSDTWPAPGQIRIAQGGGWAFRHGLCFVAAHH